MKLFTVRRLRFKLGTFLAALHGFSVRYMGDGNPLPAVSGEIVYFDIIDLIEALASDTDEEFGDIPDDSLARLEMGLTLFGQFAAFDGESAFDFADGTRVEVPCLDGEDEEPRMPRRRRTRKYREAVENTLADECGSFGYLISLTADRVEIEAKGMSDVGGDCELEPMAEPNLLSEAMRRWVKTFVIRGR